MNDVWIAIIGGIVALSTGFMQYRQQGVLNKISKKQDTDKKIKERRKELMKFERDKNNKMELSIIANNELTTQLARHEIDGNHIELLKQKHEASDSANKEFSAARKRLEEEYQKYNQFLSDITED